MQPDDVNHLLRVLDLTGVFANAVLGGVIARQERLDPIGFLVLAVLSGLGGGLIRDVLLQHGPPPPSPTRRTSSRPSRAPPSAI